MNRLPPKASLKQESSHVGLVYGVEEITKEISLDKLPDSQASSPR